MASTVVLIHGVLMSGREMSLLRFRLRRDGFNVRQYRYESRRYTPVENAQALQQALIDWQLEGTVHFVAHSLGGIVLAHFFNRYQWRHPGRVVLLGVPLRGSSVARRLSHSPWGRWLLGCSLVDGLLQQAPPWPGARKTLMIAGIWGLGLGQVLSLGRLPGPSDGVVRLCEVEDAAITDRLILPVNHTQLVVSSRVARAIAKFLSPGPSA